MQPALAVDEQVGYLVKRLQQLTRSAMDERLAEHRVSMATYAALGALEHHADLSNAELARRCFVTPQTMNALVRTLEAEGLVDRHPHPEHGRIIETRLTPRGRELVDVCHKEVAQVHDVMLAGLTSAQADQLAAWLRQCVSALDPEAR